jgi:hypothetical protein
MARASKADGSKSGRTMLRLATVAFMTAGLFAAGPELVHREQQRFATKLGRHALDLGEAESLESVRRLQLIGLPAVEPLMKLAASQRADVAEAAQTAIADQLAAWEVKFAERGDQQAFAEEIDGLAAAIAGRYSEFGSAGRHWAERLARRLAAHAAGLAGEGGWQAVTLYDRLLSAETPVSDSRPAQAPFPETAGAMSQTPPAVSLEQPAPVEPLVQKPVADLPTELSMRATMEPAAIAVRPLPPPAASVPEHEAAAPLAEAPKTPGDSTGDKPSAAAPMTDVPSPLDMRHSLQEYRRLSDRQLMAQLETASRFEAAAMRKILAGRGYSDEMLTLTRELRKLPAPQRLDAIERAATLPTSDARLLLRWFLADDDAEVRLQALTTLATSGDPKMAEIARRCAVEDADPRVADLASKLLKQR